MEKKKKKIRLEKDRGGELAYKKRLRDRRRVKRDQDRERERERERERGCAMDIPQCDGLICGRGATKLGKLNRPLPDLIEEAFRQALADASLPEESVKGLVAMPAVADLGQLSLMPAHQMAMDLGLLTRPGGQDMVCRTVDCGGASPVVALREACQLLRDEGLGCVAVVGADAVGSMPTKEFLRRVGGSSGDQGAVIPKKYDEFASWHARCFGTKREDLASVSEFMSLQAARHPGNFQKPGDCLSAADVLASPRVAGTTNLYECAKRADGAAVVLVCSPEFARSRGSLFKCVPILGIGEASGALMPESRHIGAHAVPIHLAARRAMLKAGVRSAREIGWFGLYDCFPVAFLSALEQVGLCGYGEAGSWVAGAIRKVRAGGKVPVNTHGGLLGAGAPWEAPAMFTIVEAYDQLLGRCAADRQCDGARRALVQANGGTFSHEAVVVLGWPAGRAASPAMPAAAVGGFSHLPLCRILGTRVPVMSAGMAGVAGARLAAEVSEAGGMGCVGAASLSVEQIRAECAEIRRLTRQPFAVNILALDDDFEAKARAVAEGGARALVTGLGVPRGMVDFLKGRGLLVGVVCGKVSHAVKAAQSGCDFVVAQGAGAGGHTGQVALFSLLPQIRSAVPESVHVVAAGGIHDGATFVAALGLGASGVWVGTRFLASHEAKAAPGYKERLLLATGAEDTSITRYYTGKPCRVLKNARTEEFERSGEKADGFPAQYLKSRREGNNHLVVGGLNVSVDPDSEFMPAGQVVGSINHVLPAREVVESIVREAEEVLRGLRGVARL